MQDARLVEKKKNELIKKKCTEMTKRSQLTSYIGKTLNSRQEDVPLVGPYIDHAKCEPLHLKNNTVKELFMKVFKLCICEGNVKNYKSFSQIPDDILFVELVKFIRHSMGCNQLAKRLITWFNESSTKNEKYFAFRFRGKESVSYLKHLPNMIDFIVPQMADIEKKVLLHEIHHQSILLRRIISYSIRIETYA